MRMTEKGQVTIPKELRDRFAIMPGSQVEFVVEGDTLVVRKVAEDHGRGRALVDSMRGRGSGRLSTDEIMQLTRGE